MRIGLVRDLPTTQGVDPLCRRVAAVAGRTDGVSLFRLRLLLNEIADEATSLHNEQRDAMCWFA